MSSLAARVNLLGGWLRRRHGGWVHKIPLDAGLTCPNRDGSQGSGGCTFCNNASFSPLHRQVPDISQQLAQGTSLLGRRREPVGLLAYFQAYTNTYADVARLDEMYRLALQAPGVIGLSVGTRPDCVPPPVLDLLATYQDEGYTVWLELGLQSAFDATLQRVNRGHDVACYQDAVQRARARGLAVCTHLILGLPGESAAHTEHTMEQVLAWGTDGLKLHPLHVVRHTRMALDWKAGTYQALAQHDYVRQVCDVIERTPEHVVFHRLTGTAPPRLLLAPDWCVSKWPVLNAIEAELLRRGTRQGSRCDGRPESRDSDRSDPWPAPRAPAASLEVTCHAA